VQSAALKKKKIKSNKSAAALRAVSRLKEFTMATKHIKSNKSTTALRAVSRLKEGNDLKIRILLTIKLHEREHDIV
jgi:hypothetical protein